MSSKQECRSLHVPKLTPITKQQYRKFVFVRKLHSQPLGEHSLLSHNHRKYIQKCLPIGCCFLTLRPPSQHIYHYTEQGNNCYIFQLLGEPLTHVLRGSIGQEIKEWVDKCDGFDNALMDLLRYCVRLHAEKGLQDIVADCFRIWEGQICYNWDTWMRGTLEIVKNNNLEIENYFLSEQELRSLEKTKLKVIPDSISISYRQYLYKVGLFLLNLALPEIKTRTYQYCQLSLNKGHITQKLGLLKIKASKELHSFVTKFINCQIQSFETLCRMLEGSYCNRGESPSIESYASGTKPGFKTSQKQKQNSGTGEQPWGFGHARRFSTASKLDAQVNKFSSSKKPRARGRSGNLNQSSNIISIGQQQRNSKPFSLKQSLSKPPSGSVKMLDYLSLTEHVAESLYEKSIISCLEGLRVKTDWTHKIYANGSIYLGDLADEKRTGRGIYLFDSEDLYVGDWAENCIHGLGCYVFRSGEVYSGELRKGLKHGFGSFSYKDGRVYEGNWEENIKCGFGTVIFPNGMKFLGFFNKGSETYGLFTMVKGETVIQFQGSLEKYNWEANSWEASGTVASKSTKKQMGGQVKSQIEINGEWKQNQHDGYGVKETEIEIIEGHWKKGKQEGAGRLKVKNKFELEGIWQDGILIQYRC